MIEPIVIDYNYCIINNAAGQISRVFWEGIDKTKITPTIVCGDQTTMDLSTNKLHKVHDYAFIRKMFAIIKKIGFPDVYYIPDTEYFSWCPFAFKEIIKNSRKHRYTYIHSISSPQSTHLLAKSLKQRLNIPWVAQFDDPWHDASGRKYKTKYFSNYDLKLEKEIAEYADLIIHSNEVIRDIWIERYGDIVKDKIVILPFNFNIQNLPEVLPIPETSTLEISHIGHIYSTRSAMTIFNAMKSLLEENPGILAKIHLNFIGDIHSEEKVYVKEQGLSKYVSFWDTIPPEDLEAYYQKSHAFLLIDVNIVKSPNYPSKLMMYYYYQRPIIGITNPGSQLVREMEQTGNHYVYYGQDDKLANILKDLVLNYKKYLHFDHNCWKRHTVDNVHNLYYQLLTEHLGFSL